MLKIKMIAHKGKPNKSGRVPILMQLTIGQQTCHISTKQNILPEKWGDGKPIGHTREDQAITAVLEEIRTKAYNKFLQLQGQNINVTPERLKQALLGKDQVQPRGYVEIFDQWLVEYSKMVGITTSKRTLDKYILVRNRLQDYIASQLGVKDISLEEVTPKFLSNFDNYLRVEYNMANNHAMKIRQKLRTIYKVAIDNGWVSKNPFSTVKIHFEPVERDVLTKSELTALIQTDMIFDRLENYHKLTNLIWVWNGQSEKTLVDKDTFDIASLDIYLSPEKEFGSRYEQFLALQNIVGKEKLIALSECSTLPDTDVSFRDNSVWSFFGLWYGKYLHDDEGNFSEIYSKKDSFIKNYNSDGVLTLDEYTILRGGEKLVPQYDESVTTAAATEISTDSTNTSDTTAYTETTAAVW